MSKRYSEKAMTDEVSHFHVHDLPVNAMYIEDPFDTRRNLNDNEEQADTIERESHVFRNFKA